MLRILIVGQTPPPFGGQAVMIEQMLKGNYSKIKLYHVRMAFSREMDEIGKFNVFKLFHLAYIVMSIFYYRFRYNIKVLYYPPGGYDRNPMLRDLVILNCTRWLFAKTVFHFHALGVSNFNGQLSGVGNYFFRRAYFFSDTAIRPASHTLPDDGSELRAVKNIVVYNGIQDYYSPGLRTESTRNPVKILFLGMIRVEKGVECLIRAASALKDNRIDFVVQMVGKFESVNYEQCIRDLVTSLGLVENILFLGVKEGSEKHRLYANADIFCLPSHSETFGLVCVEAMQFKLPVVGTNIGSLSEIISDGRSGYLFPVDDAIQLAGILEKLALSQDLRIAMGETGRKEYLNKFAVSKFYTEMETAFLNA